MGPGGMGDQAATYQQIMSIIDDEFQKAERDKPTNDNQAPGNSPTKVSLFDKAAHPMHGKTGLAASVATPPTGRKP